MKLIKHGEKVSQFQQVLCSALQYEFYINRKVSSMACLGLYWDMLSVPEYDYLTFEEICSFHPADTPSELKQIVDELVNHNFLIHLKNKDVFAVNKFVMLDIIENKDNYAESYMNACANVC